MSPRGASQGRLEPAHSSSRVKRLRGGLLEALEYPVNASEPPDETIVDMVRALNSGRDPLIEARYLLDAPERPSE